VSSYFDEASRQYRQAETPEKKREVVDTVTKRVREYLDYISRTCLKAERPKLEPLEVKFRKACDGPWDDEMSFMVIEDLHDLGHDIGRARIALRRQGVARDNPYFEGRR